MLAIFFRLWLRLRLLFTALSWTGRILEPGQWGRRNGRTHWGGDCAKSSHTVTYGCWSGCDPDPSSSGRAEAPSCAPPPARRPADGSGSARGGRRAPACLHSAAAPRCAAVLSCHWPAPPGGVGPRLPLPVPLRRLGVPHPSPPKASAKTRSRTVA